MIGGRNYGTRQRAQRRGARHATTPIALEPRRDPEYRASLAPSSAGPELRAIG